MPDTLRFIGIMKDATTAGPGKRLEFFTKGCIRGVVNPCKGCFNESTWTFKGPYRELSIDEVVEICDRDAWNRQVTFCGGEPMLQAIGITQVARRLKAIDPTFHIIMYTAYQLDVLMNHGLYMTWVSDKHDVEMKNHLMYYSDITYDDLEVKQRKDGSIAYKMRLLSPQEVRELMAFVDLIIDGDYQHDKRLTTHKTMHDGGFIGSANQRVIDTKRSLAQNNLIFEYADVYMARRDAAKHCLCCGHNISDDRTFCSILCKYRYKDRQKQLAQFSL